MNPLAIAPLMHGGGQWPTFIGLYSGGKSVIYTERSYDADKVLGLCQDEDVMTLSLVGDAMARPLAEAKLADSYELPVLMNVGSGGAMLTKPVKDQLRKAFPGRDHHRRVRRLRDRFGRGRHRQRQRHGGGEVLGRRQHGRAG